MTPDEEMDWLYECERLLAEQRSSEAMVVLDKLCTGYVKQGQIAQLITTLQGFVNTFPDDMGVRKRLGLLYMKRGRKRAAREQFDILGELQLDAGLLHDAADTIKLLMSLDEPPGPHDPAA